MYCSFSRKAWLRRSVEVSTRILRPSCLMSSDVRVLASRGSFEEQAGQLQPTIGTPVDVPLPSMVNLISEPFSIIWLKIAEATPSGKAVFSYARAVDTWTALSKSLSTRSNAFGAWDGARFVVWGGIDNMGLRSDGAYYQGSATWPALSAVGAPTARMAVPRRSGWLFETRPGVLALFGGQTSTSGPGTFTTTGATYDVIDGKWSTAAAFPSGELHDYGVAVWTGDEFVLWGGRTGMALAPTLTGERWKP